MLFNDDDRNTKNALTLNEFKFIKQNKAFLVETIKKFIEQKFAATHIYDFLNKYMPGFYARFYFHMCYVNVIDTRNEVFNEELMHDSLFYCKQYYEKLNRMDLYDGQIKNKGIMFLVINQDGYIFNSYLYDAILITFFNFVDQFKTYDNYLKNNESFLSLINFAYESYQSDMEILDQSFLLFGKPKIEHY